MASRLTAQAAVAEPQHPIYFKDPAGLIRNAGFQVILECRIIIASIEIMHMIRKGEMDCPAGPTMPAAQQFYSLAV